MPTRLLNTCFMVSAALLLASCGGGSSSPSGGSGGGSTPPPTPTNAAPTASIAVTDMSPNEGKTSTLDASGSSDADGDSLTYSWTQLSGPNLNFTAPNGLTTDVLVPDLTTDISARIQLQVSDGTATASAETTLNLTNVVLTPAANSTITNEKSFSYANRIISIPTLRVFFETTNYFVYEMGGRLIWDSFGYDANDDPILFAEGVIDSDLGKVISEGLNTNSRIFVLLSSDAVNIYDTVFDPPTRFVINAPQPCAIEFASGFRGNNRIIGLENGGATLVSTAGLPLDGSSTILQTVEAGSSICELKIANQALDNLFPMTPVTQKLMAFDQTNNQIIAYRLVENSNGELVDLIEDSRVPIDLSLSAGGTAEFVSSLKIDARGAGAMALLFSDGNTEGTHRLVIIGLGEDDAILQETFSWDYGTPTSIASAAVDEHQGVTLLITTSDSPFGIVFKSGEINAGPNPFLPMSGPSFFDLGVGHDLVASFAAGAPATPGIIVTYPDQNLVKTLERN